MNAGLHFLGGAVYFTTSTIAVCWAANHDRTRFVGDMIAWMQCVGWFLDIAAHSIIISAFMGNPVPAGFGYNEIVPLMWGILLVSKNLTLATGLVYALIIRILAWTAWKDDAPKADVEMPNLKAAQAAAL